MTGPLPVGWIGSWGLTNTSGIQTQAWDTNELVTAAYLVDFAGSTELHLRQDATVDWSEALYDPDALGVGVGASDWARNLIRWRAALRAGFVVKRPAGVVRIDLTQPV